MNPINFGTVFVLAVASSLLNAVAYCPISRSLVVQFHSGAAYGYFDVPIEVVEGLLFAESKGAYFNKRVRGRFRDVYLAPGVRDRATAPRLGQVERLGD